MYITEPLHRLIIAAQLAASVNALFAAMPLMLFVTSTAPGVNGGALVITLFGAFSLLTSIALFLLAGLMSQGRLWAYFVTWIVAVLLALQVVVDIGGMIAFGGEQYAMRRMVCCGMAHLPHLLLAVAAINS